MVWSKTLLLEGAHVVVEKHYEIARCSSWLLLVLLLFANSSLRENYDDRKSSLVEEENQPSEKCPITFSVRIAPASRSWKHHNRPVLLAEDQQLTFRFVLPLNLNYPA